MQIKTIKIHFELVASHTSFDWIYDCPQKNGNYSFPFQKMSHKEKHFIEKKIKSGKYPCFNALIFEWVFDYVVHDIFSSRKALVSAILIIYIMAQRVLSGFKRCLNRIGLSLVRIRYFHTIFIPSLDVK